MSHVPGALAHPGVVFEEIFRNTPMGIAFSDLHGTLIDFNESFRELVGYDREELIGASLFSFIHSDDRGEFDGQITSLREGARGNYVTKRRYVRKSGEIIHVEVSVSVVYAADKQPLCAVAFVEDITASVAMEDQLRQSEKRYRRVVEDQTELIVRCLPDGTRTFVNEAYCRYFGVDANELIGSSFFPLIIEEEREAVRQKYAAFSPSNRVILDEHRVIRGDGAVRWQQWSDRGLFDESGTLVEIQSVGRDITEEREARERVEKSEERYRRLFAGLPIAAWESDWTTVVAGMQELGIRDSQSLIDIIDERPEVFFALGSAVVVREINPAALELFGVTTNDEFRAWLPKAHNIDSARRYTRAAAPIIFGQQAITEVEATLTRRNGDPVDVLFRLSRSDRWLEDFMVFVIAIDVTDSRKMERELIHRQELTDRAEAAGLMGSWEWNASEEAIHGTRGFWRLIDGHEDGHRERPFADVFNAMAPQQRELSEELWLSLREPTSEERPKMTEREWRLPRADGTTTLVHTQSFLSYNPDGSLARAFGIVRDVTQARRAEQEAQRQREELVRADKMISLGILVSGVAHEINNPNHSIMLNVPLLRRAWRDAEEIIQRANDKGVRIAGMPLDDASFEIGEMLTDIEHAAERIRTIVAELRAYALEQTPGSHSQIALNEVVRSSMRLLVNHLRKATRHFSLDLGEGLPRVSGNSRRLEQVIMNLVINACQALDTDQQAITLTTGSDRESKRVFIRVHDEGRGIAKENLAKIRDPFFTTRRSEGGTGLGLSVSDRITEEHGGSLEIESEVGRGTTATLWLPVVD